MHTSVNLLYIALVITISTVYCQRCVTGTGSCLNIRATPNPQASIITCASDGTMLEDLNEIVSSNSIRWRSIRIDGRQGWAADQFLSRCDAGSGGNGNFAVLGNTLTQGQAKWVRYVASSVLPRLINYWGRETALTNAAYVTWWSLKEGVLDLTDPRPFSLCDPGHRVITNNWAGTCLSPTYGTWQVGISAIQAPRTDTSANNMIGSLESLANQLYSNSASRVLSDFARDVGFGSNADSIQNSRGMVRAAWLLRVPAVGFVRQAPTVASECIGDNPRGWCYSTGWDSSKRYAPTAASISNAIRDVRNILQRLS